MQTRQDGAGVVVTTRDGQIEGSWHHGVARFAGVPFAAPPTGPRRFLPPSPPDPWEGVRPARGFASVAPQNPSIMEMLMGEDAEVWDEDCLYLNVWTTDPEHEGRPVMVWVHGGGFEMGSGSSPIYRGESFARQGVVLVTINYRLGAFGFLELGGVDPALAGSGNVGLLDQIAALEWVRDNIAAFGGDPGKVTIFGESAGAMSVSLLLAMPKAKGLFRGVIAQSGAASAARTPAQAAADTEEFLDHCGVSTVADLRAAPAATLLGAHAAMGAARIANPEATIARTGNPLGFLAFRPVADGGEVPADPLAAIAAGASPGVPLMVGTNLEEWKLFAMMSPSASTEEELTARLTIVTDDPAKAVEVYRAEHPGATPAEIETAALTDVVFRAPASHLADAHAAHAPVWQYRWDWASPSMGGMIGASHAVELPFVFGVLDDPRLAVLVGSEPPADLAELANATWAAFARDLEPTADRLPEWPTVEPGRRPVMVLAEEPTLLEDPHADSLRFWEP